MNRIKILIAGMVLISSIFLINLSVVYATSPPPTAYLAGGLLGQTNYTSYAADQGGSTSASTLDLPSTVSIDKVHHRLFVLDSENNRVLVYNLDSNNNVISSTANYVLGQSNFTSAVNGGVTQNTISNNDNGLAYDSADNLLFVSDGTFNNRILVFNVANLSNDMNASYVLGQANFTSNNLSATQSSLDDAIGLAYDAADHLLFVADSGNNRVLAYNTSSLSNGMNASYVLGQANFTSAVNNPAAQNDFNNPTALSYDSANHLLFVADSSNNRVLAFNTSSLSNGMNASYVLGQANFTSTTCNTTQNGLCSATALAYDSINNLLYVSDGYRMLSFSLTNLVNGENAMGVVGQSTFTTSTGYSANQSSLDYVSGLAFNPSNNSLYVADENNNRVLIYNFVKITTPSLTSATNGTNYSQSFASINSQGTVTYQVTGGSLPPGLTLSSTGVISGTPTQNGTYTFEVTAYDNNGTMGTFVDDPSYTIVVASSTTSTTTTKAPNTGFGVSLNRPLQTLAIYGFGAFGLILLAIVVRKKVTKQGN